MRDEHCIASVICYICLLVFLLHVCLPNSLSCQSLYHLLIHLIKTIPSICSFIHHHINTLYPTICIYLFVCIHVYLSIHNNYLQSIQLLYIAPPHRLNIVHNTFPWPLYSARVKLICWSTWAHTKEIPSHHDVYGKNGCFTLVWHC